MHLLLCFFKYLNGIILLARIAHPNCKKYLAFFDAFNKTHSYSMVCHPVGIHNDHFKEGDESLENKILLLIDNDPGPGNSKVLGRGGCIMGTHFVYALLDW